MKRRGNHITVSERWQEFRRAIEPELQAKRPVELVAFRLPQQDDGFVTTRFNPGEGHAHGAGIGRRWHDKVKRTKRGSGKVGTRSQYFYS